MCLEEQEWKWSIIFDHTRLVYYKYRREKMHLNGVGANTAEGLGEKAVSHGFPCYQSHVDSLIRYGFACQSNDGVYFTLVRMLNERQCRFKQAGLVRLRLLGTD